MFSNSPQTVQVQDALDRELFEMIDHARSRERVDRLRRGLSRSVVIAGPLALVASLVLGVVVWGWLRTAVAVYTVSVVLVIALVATDDWGARRTARETDDR